MYTMRRARPTTSKPKEKTELYQQQAVHKDTTIYTGILSDKRFVQCTSNILQNRK